MKKYIPLAIVVFSMNVQACPLGQVENQSGECDWVTPPSFYVPAAQTLHCRTVHVLGKKEIYDIDLRWNGKGMDIDRVWLVK